MIFLCRLVRSTPRAWAGWVVFQSFGYAGFLFPLLLGAWGASAFVRPLVARGWLPFAGLALLLVAATGLLTQAAVGVAVSRGLRTVPASGGLVGRVVATTLRAGIGDVGVWILLIAAVPIGVLLVTRVSFAAIARVAGARLAALRRALYDPDRPRARSPGRRGRPGTTPPLPLQSVHQRPGRDAARGDALPANAERDSVRA